MILLAIFSAPVAYILLRLAILRVGQYLPILEPGGERHADE